MPDNADKTTETRYFLENMFIEISVKLRQYIRKFSLTQTENKMTHQSKFFYHLTWLVCL